MLFFAYDRKSSNQWEHAKCQTIENNCSMYIDYMCTQWRLQVFCFVLSVLFFKTIAKKASSMGQIHKRSYDSI